MSPESTDERADLLRAALAQQEAANPSLTGRLPPDTKAIMRVAGMVLPESEADFQRWTIDYAEWHGWAVFHTYDSRRSNPGWPDLVLVRDRVLFRELKTNSGRLSVEQAACLNRLTAAGADAKVWRPRDRRSVEQELQ